MESASEFSPLLHFKFDASPPSSETRSKLSDSTYRPTSDLHYRYYHSSYCGTSEDSIVWFNSANYISLALAMFVITLIVYSTVVSIIIIVYEDLPLVHAVIVFVLSFMSLLCDCVTMLSDPGAVPANAYPLPKDIRNGVPIIMCATCDAYKPVSAHHDRISNRCISRMDHYCPWTNNAIGAKNQKNFILFLLYTDAACIYMLVLIAKHLVISFFFF